MSTFAEGEFGVGPAERQAKREERARQHYERALLWGRTLTCAEMPLDRHVTCVGNEQPSRCSCPCHDEQRPKEQR